MVTEWVPSRIRQPPSTRFHLSLSPPTSPFSLRDGQQEGRRLPQPPLSFHQTTPKSLVSSSALLHSWPVDQAMAHQILLATLPILTTNGREATLQNMAPTAEPPLQTQARFLWLLTTNPPAMMLIVCVLHIWRSAHISPRPFFFHSPRPRFRLGPPLQSPVYRLCRISLERYQHEPAWSLLRHTRILCTLSCVVFRTPDTHLHGGNRRYIP